MADEKKFALPDSQQFRAFYAQKRRRSRNSNIPIVVPITKNFINLLGDPPQAYYELATPWVATGDFEIEVDFSTTSNLGIAFVGNSANTFDFFSLAGGTISGRINGTVISFATPDAKDGKLHKAILKRVGITPTVILDGVEYPESSLTTVSGTSNFNVIGQSSNSAFFTGIISDVKLTDITTPANSLAFGLDNLTGDTEVNNGVTLNYRNIALDVRETYTLTDGDWLGGYEYLTNGDFATDTGWFTQTGWSISGGTANTVAGSAYTGIIQLDVITANLNYRVSYEVSNYATGFTQVNNFSGNVPSQGNGAFSRDGVITSTAFNLGNTNVEGIYSIDNVSVKRLIEVA
jgi:hypothetical protein